MSMGYGPLGDRPQARGSASQALIAYHLFDTGSGEIVAPQNCDALVYAWGGGASGGSDTGTVASGGGSGAAAFRRFRMIKNQVLTYSVGAGGVGVSAINNGNPGGDTTVSVGGVTMTAGGGLPGLGIGSLPRAGGQGGRVINAQIARDGASGGIADSPNGTAGGVGEFGGGTGGAQDAGRGGGAAAAGFSDLSSLAPFLGGSGSNGNSSGNSAAGTAPGGGSGGTSNTSGAGAPGRVVVILLAR